METLITLIRHGESIWNATGRAQGHAPVPLSEIGHEQARQVADVMRGEAVSALYCSDLLRCRQTAAPVAAALGLEVKLDASFREINVGIWQGLTWQERGVFDPESHSAFTADPLNAPIPNGESTMQMVERVMVALRAILAEYVGGHVVVVTHGGPIRAVLREYGYWPNRVWGVDMPPIQNASRTVLRVTGETAAELLLLGDVSHLSPELVTQGS